MPDLGYGFPFNFTDCRRQIVWSLAAKQPRHQKGGGNVMFWFQNGFTVNCLLNPKETFFVVERFKDISHECG